MTSQKDQIQRLIAEIDATLAKPASRLPLGLSGEAERQRQLLGKLFGYLQSLEQTFDSPGGWGPIDPGTGEFVVSSQSAAPNLEQEASQVLQGMLQEMRYLRENSLKPMRQELEVLQQRRDSLQAEVNVLEAQRSPDPLQSEQQINDFLETLMQRLQEKLSAQMVQNFAAMEAATVEQLSAADNPAPLLTGQRLEQVRLLQAQSDQLLLKLDSTLTAVFNSLQKSVDSYRESLEEGLDQMHGLGRQGEVIFHAFVNHLAQQLGEDASSYLSGELGKAVQQAALQEPDQVTADVDLGTVQLDELDQALDDLVLGEDAGDPGGDPAFDIAPDLSLLEDAIASDDIESGAFQGIDLDDLETDEDSTIIQSDGLSDMDAELALLEDAIASGPDDEDITIIQNDSGFNPVVDLDEEITAIQPDDMPDVEAELALLEDAIAPINLDGAIDLDEVSAGLGNGTALGEPFLPNVEDLSSGDEPPEDLSSEDLFPQDGAQEDGAPAGLSQEDGLPENEAPEESSQGDEPPSSTLELSLGDIDESLGLLAIGADGGADSGNLSSLTDEASDQDELPQIEAEGELFNFDADFDLGLEPRTPADESIDLFEGAIFLDDPSDPITSDALSPADTPPADADGEPLAESDLSDADQVADSWLFDLGPADDQPAPATSLGLTQAELTDPSDSSGDEIAVATVETLFGDGTPAQTDPTEEIVDSGDTVTSLSELLPDEQTSEAGEDFPENVPDDIYIAASADEDLINLVESRAEQRLLIDFDDGQLVEQLDEDLQKLAGDTFSADYGVEEDDALEPLDQDTLENIVSELNLEDLNLEDGQVSAPAAPEEVAPVEESLDGDVAEASLSAGDDDLDLFEGFATDAVDVDDPSANDIDLAVIAPTPIADPGSQELDLIGLITEPLADEFDDGLPDSLADELGGLSEQSNALSHQPAEEVIGQILSDLEESVTGEDEALSVPAIEATEPGLDSASTPDLPPDLLTAELNPDSPASDDFLQAEQEAFWQTMAADDTASPMTTDTAAAPSEDLSFAEMSGAEAFDLEEVDLEEVDLEMPDAGDGNGGDNGEDAPLDAVSDDMSLEAVSEDLADDLDDLLIVDDLPSSEMAEEEDALGLDELDELFGQSSLDDLDVLGQDDLSQSDVAQPLDPLAELGLDTTTSPEALIPLIPDVPEDSGATLPVVPLGRDEDSNDGDRAAADSATPGAAPPVIEPEPPAVNLDGDWFLGLDVGATGLSAVLMNRRTGQVYPLYWQTGSDDTKHFRLPAVAVMTSAQDTVAVGYDALGDLSDLLDTSGDSTELIGVNRLKPLLKVAVGHGQTLPNSDPWVRWSDTVELPMLQMLQAMVALLKYSVNQGQAVGLEGDGLAQVLANLQGVIVGYPTNWPDTYSFNLREAVLAAGLIAQPEQVVFVEDAIASVLSGLPDPRDSALAETVSLSRQPSLYNCQWQDGTVIISGGAVMTELGVVHLPKDLASLNYADFALRGFAYAGDALDQDIVCQLLLPQERRQSLSEIDAEATRWDWQGHLAAEDADWSLLNLDDLTLPNVGHVDWAQRYGLQHRLLGSNLGQSLLAAARHLKLALQQQSQMQITLAGQCWLIKRRHLENLIFLPYIQRINRYLNVLLSNNTVDAQSIKQVLCTGGSASLPAIARWLRQKFPNATIIQDTYASELPQSCSRVAYGLVNLARYPQVLNVTRQQYSDYFLLMELLRVFPQQPLPVGAILHLLEQRGINTQACHLHILALLEGHLPPGLVPTAADRGLICDRTTDLPTYRALLQTPLFNKTITESGGHMYIPNEGQAVQLRAYLSRLLLDKVQTLDEPLIAQLEVLA
ncbi:MAG: hypothetical protein AAF243_03590 [Cyanobacteria bacterium P01_A01_bin.137]